jgi:hypothetical protein
MIKKIIIFTAALWLMFSVLNLPLTPVVAQGSGSITVSNSTAKMNFPLSLEFSSQIKSTANISDIRLRYQIQQMSFAQVTSEAYINTTASATKNAVYSLDMRKVGGLPPGTSLNYWWAVKDASGANMQSPPVQFQVNDNRYTWQNLSQGKINLFWYQGDNTFAQDLMSAAQQALAQLLDNTGASPDKVINVYIYASAKDLQGSMIFPSEWTGGVAFTQYNIVAIGIGPNDLSWGRGAMTHELTHIVIHQVTFNPYNDLPVWLNEGLAMSSEGPLTKQFTVPLKLAISRNGIIPVRSIASPFSADSNKAVLSYAESYTLVEYLVKQYGSGKMLNLLQTFQNGSTSDGAFQKVYGFDMDGLDNQWRNWVSTQYK